MCGHPRGGGAGPRNSGKRGELRMSTRRTSDDRAVAEPLAAQVCSGFSRRVLTLVAGGALVGMSLAGCSSVDSIGSKLDPTYGVEVSPRVVGEGEAVPKGGGSYKVGKPYKVAGKTYVPSEDPNYAAEGFASWYGRDFHGRKTANGEVFDMQSISVAHRTLPMPSYVRVTNLANKRSIIARVNNRGPYVSGRIVDVSYKTAELLGFAKFGVARVRVEYVGRASLDGSDDRQLAMTLRQDGDPAQLPGASPVMVASAKPFIPSLPEATPVSVAEAPLPKPSRCRWPQPRSRRRRPLRRSRPRAPSPFRAPSRFPVPSPPRQRRALRRQAPRWRRPPSRCRPRSPRRRQSRQIPRSRLPAPSRTPSPLLRLPSRPRAFRRLRWPRRFPLRATPTSRASAGRVGRRR